MNGEVIITLNWLGRLRILLTGKLTLREPLIRYALSQIQRLQNGGDDE